MMMRVEFEASEIPSFYKRWWGYLKIWTIELFTIFLLSRMFQTKSYWVWFDYEENPESSPFWEAYEQARSEAHKKVQEKEEQL